MECQNEYHQNRIYIFAKDYKWNNATFIIHVHVSFSKIVTASATTFSKSLSRNMRRKKNVVNTRQPCLLQCASNIGEELAREKIINCASHGSRHSRSSMLFTHQLVVPPIMERIGRMRSSQDSERERRLRPKEECPFPSCHSRQACNKGGIKAERGDDRRRSLAQSFMPTTCSTQNDTKSELKCREVDSRCSVY